MWKEGLKMELEEIWLRLDEFTKGNDTDARIEIPKINAIKLMDYIHHLEEIKRICYLVFEKERKV